MYSHKKLQSIWIVVLDCLCLLFSIVMAASLRFGPEEMVQFVLGRLDGWLLFVASILTANYLAGSYRIQFTLSRFNLLVTWLFSVSVAVLILSVTSYAWLRILLGRGVLGLSILFYSILSLYVRLVVIRAVCRWGGLVTRVMIMDDHGMSNRIRNYIENPFVLPQHDVCGWLRICESGLRRPAGAGEALHGLPVVEATVDELPALMASMDVDLLVTKHSLARTDWKLSNALRKLRFKGTEVMTPLTVGEAFCGRVQLDLVDAAEILRSGFESGVPTVFRIKRFLDVVFAVVAGLVLWPVGMMVAIAIKLAEPHAPVLYKQERVGQFGETFTIVKFRTMLVGAEEESGAIWSPMTDPRITRVGRVLRTFRLDEIPQIWNIMKGDMSLVGPRPERPTIVSALEREIPFFREREYAVPGITGWAQIHSMYGNSLEASRRKLEYDLYYIKNMSLSLDLQIVLRTIRIVLLGKEKHA